MVKQALREEARRLRRGGSAVRSIAEQLGVSRSSVSIWVRDIELTDAQIESLKARQHRYGAQNAGARSNRVAYQQQRLAYQEAGRMRARENRPLHLAGCMLYWAEGAKTRNSLIFVNSDSAMMLLFMRFLREELAVQDTSVSLSVHCHTSDPIAIKNLTTYWLDLLKLPPSCLRRTHVKKGSEIRRNILPYGVCRIEVYSTELVHHIYGAIQEYASVDKPAWLF